MNESIRQQSDEADVRARFDHEAALRAPGQLGSQVEDLISNGQYEEARRILDLAKIADTSKVEDIAILTLADYVETEDRQHDQVYTREDILAVATAAALEATYQARQEGAHVLEAIEVEGV